jgi:hypothetical protein
MKGDFFVIEELFNKSVFIYIMIGFCGLGVLIKIILQLVYGSLAKASYNMGVSKNLLTRNMKKKFETCYKLKIGVNNVDIFVDKYLLSHKFCGILLSTWEGICGQLLLSCVLIGSISTILGIINECGRNAILNTFAAGIITSGLLIFFEGLLNISGKKEIIRLNMKDYLENFLKVRLEQGELQPELIEQYKKDLKAIEESADPINSSALTAATIEPKMKKGKIITPGVKETRKERKKKLKQARKRSILEEKAAKKSIEEEKRNEKVIKKEEIKKRKLQAKEDKQKIKNDAKVAIERKKEAERQEIEKIRAEVKLQEDKKREEKRNQEEIKRVLMLEKVVQKEEKKKVDNKTLAQEKKEVLLKEINERRNQEAQQNNESNLDNTKNIIEVVPVNHKETPHNSVQLAKEEVAISNDTNKVKLDTNTKVQLQNILNKGIKKGNVAEDKLIEDILKEFLS